MYQIDFLRETLLACKHQGIHTTVDTSGHASWDSFEVIYPLVDLFLYDLKLMDDIKHKLYTSVTNQLILNNLDKLSRVKAHLHVRIPLIPGVNDDENTLEQFASFLAGVPNLEGAELMPYHEIGVAKYPALGMNYKLEGTQPALRERIAWVEELLSSYHLPVIQHFSRRSE